jgi:hypothetical protein
MSGLEGGTSALYLMDLPTRITWNSLLSKNGSASKVVLCASNGQVKIEKITIEFE